MKTTRAWQLGVKDILVMSSSRQRPHLKRPVWIIVLVTFVSIFLITAYVYPPTSSAACYIFSSRGCTLYNQPPTFPSRELSDDETISQVVIREILKTPPILSKKSKIAFLFLTPGTLPFEELWDKFFRGHEHRFSVFVHASKGKPVHTSRYFIGRDIHSEKVVWGKISMVDAERRLLAHALLDPDNQQFVLLSDSCIPLHNFDYVYNYLMLTNVSFIDSFVDLGPHGTGRYSEHMMPEVEKSAFRKGSQPNMDGRNCYADEHYLPTFFNVGTSDLFLLLASKLPLVHMIDPGGIANRSVTYVDWSEAKWHPRSFRAQDITYEFLRNLTSIDKSVHFTSDPKVKEESDYGALLVEHSEATVLFICTKVLSRNPGQIDDPFL
ncbi:Glycosyl transferase [Theobroma cacao]|nr:Glycosyl transferase [Theobroma cacao]